MILVNQAATLSYAHDVSRIYWQTPSQKRKSSLLHDLRQDEVFHRLSTAAPG